MSYAKDQKALKQPDEFQKIGRQALPWMERHGPTLMFGLLAVGVLGLGASIIYHLRQKAEAAASFELGNALGVLDREGGGPTIAKDDAIISKLQTFRGQFNGRLAAVQAELPLATALLRSGKPDDALPLLEDFLKSARPNDVLRQAAIEAQGYAFEQKKDLAQARAAFSRLADFPDPNFLKAFGRYHEGRILALQDARAEAASAYSRVVAEYPGSAAASLARERLGDLKRAGVEVSAPVSDAGL